MTPIAAMPTPLFAVPYADPKPGHKQGVWRYEGRSVELRQKIVDQGHQIFSSERSIKTVEWGQT